MTQLPLRGALALTALALPALSSASTCNQAPALNCSQPSLAEMGKHFRSALTDERLTDARSILQAVVDCKRHEALGTRN